MSEASKALFQVELQWRRDVPMALVIPAARAAYEAGASQQEIAEAAHVSQATVSRWLSTPAVSS